MSHCKISTVFSRKESAKTAELPLLRGRAVPKFESLGCKRSLPLDSPVNKEAVRASERPKSREETPVMGCGGEEVLSRNRKLFMRLFVTGHNVGHLLCQCLQ
jgi:hypothetical protein